MSGDDIVVSEVTSLGRIIAPLMAAWVESNDGRGGLIAAFVGGYESRDPEIEALRAFAENVRDNWGVLTGYELKEEAKRALLAQPAGEGEPAVADGLADESDPEYQRFEAHMNRVLGKQEAPPARQGED